MLFGLGVAALGTAMLVLGAFLARSTRAGIRAADRVAGRVVDLVRRGRAHAPTWSPVIEYDYAGETRTFTSTFSSRPPAWKQGDTVNVLVSPETPDEARIDSFGALWLLPLLCGGFGLILLAAGVGIAATGG